MRITEVRAVQPLTPESPPDWRTSLGQILVAVDTDKGLTGYGVGGGGLAGIHVVRTVLRDELLGRQAEQIDELWNCMYKATLPFGQKGLAIMALSGVDLALWDLRGKAEQKPIAEWKRSWHTDSPAGPAELKGSIAIPSSRPVNAVKDVRVRSSALRRFFRVAIPPEGGITNKMHCVFGTKILNGVADRGSR